MRSEYWTENGHKPSFWETFIRCSCRQKMSRRTHSLDQLPTWCTLSSESIKRFECSKLCSQKGELFKQTLLFYYSKLAWFSNSKYECWSLLIWISRQKNNGKHQLYLSHFQGWNERARAPSTILKNCPSSSRSRWFSLLSSFTSFSNSRYFHFHSSFPALLPEETPMFAISFSTSSM